MKVGLSRHRAATQFGVAVSTVINWVWRFQETGGAAARLAALTPPGHRVFVHVTLSDEYPLAQAHVIIEAVAMDEAAEPAPVRDMC